MAAVLWPLIRPFLGYIIGVVALIGALSGFYFKAKHDGVVAEKAKVEQEKKDAIEKATAARNHVQELCNAQGTLNKCPSEWFRD